MLVCCIKAPKVFSKHFQHSFGRLLLAISLLSPGYATCEETTKSPPATKSISPEWHMSADGVTEQNFFSRNSLKVRYHGLFWAETARHLMMTPLYSSDQQHASELTIGYKTDISTSSHLNASLGIFITSKKLLTGALHYVHQITPQRVVSAAYLRSPLALHAPLLQHETDLNRDEINVHYTHNEFLETSAHFTKDGQYTPFEKYFAAVHLPLFAHNESNLHHNIKMVFPIEHERHPKASPFYLTPLSRSDLGAGLHYSLRKDEVLEMDFYTGYLLSERSTYGAPNKQLLSDRVKVQWSGTLYREKHWKVLASSEYRYEKRYDSSASSFPRLFRWMLEGSMTLL